MAKTPHFTQRQSRLYAELLAYEIDGTNPPDGRRVIRDERLALFIPVSPARLDEAARTLKLWQEVS